MSTIEIATNPLPEDRKLLNNGLIAFNEETAGPLRLGDFVARLKDESGRMVGGISAHCFYDWAEIELLFVPKELRGQGFGKRLLDAAEKFAEQNGCIGVWLNTMDHQAPGFYEKHGYSVFGQIDDHPRGGRRYFLQKRLPG